MSGHEGQIPQWMQQQHVQGSRPHPPIHNPTYPPYMQTSQHSQQLFHQSQQQPQHSPYQLVPPHSSVNQLDQRQSLYPLQFSLPTVSPPVMLQQPTPRPHISNVHQHQQLQHPSNQQALRWTNNTDSVTETTSYHPQFFSPFENESDIERRRHQQHQPRQQLPQWTTGVQSIVPPGISPSQIGPLAQPHPVLPKSSSSRERLPELVSSPSSALIQQLETYSRSGSSHGPGFGRSTPYPARARSRRSPASAGKTPVGVTGPTETRQSRGSLPVATSGLREPQSFVAISRPGLSLLTHSSLSASTADGSLAVMPASAAGTDELLLPPQGPISIQYPLADHLLDCDIDMARMEDDNPIEVTLNIDIPKTSSPAAAGDPSVTVLSVNPSWHCVFVETVQQQRIRTWVRIQFCPSPVSSTYKDHQAKIQRLQTVQVIGYASRQVELTRRITGQNLLKKGGIIVHLDPSAISFNDASYGFTLSFSSFVAERLSRSNACKPDTPLPLTRQQNSAYCRRNLKELYYDTFSKDVLITIKPSGEVFHAHSVVLESYGYFRALLEQVTQDPVMSTARELNENNINANSSSSSSSSSGNASQALVDEEGYARPLNSQPTQRQQQQMHQQQQNQPDDGKFVRSSRLKIKIEIQDVAPNVFRAMLHYMYIGHIPTEIHSLTPENPQQQNNNTAASSAGEHGLSVAGQPPVFPADRPHSQPAAAAATIARPSSSTPSTSPPPPPAPASTPATISSTAFSWREIYEIATRFQLAGLMHLSKLVLITRLDVDNAVKELFEWAYLHWNLVPCYVSFLIENMDLRLLEIGVHGEGASSGSTATDTTTKSILWQYHDRCPRFNDIMAVFLKMLNERKEAKTLV
ncbi:hypothetical protein BGX27_009581 [Mortierella sp. AM989]|nr:hypothetical protein BGX27_009581 [Mortierella sp. AM989]